MTDLPPTGAELDAVIMEPATKREWIALAVSELSPAFAFAVLMLGLLAFAFALVTP